MGKVCPLEEGGEICVHEQLISIIAIIVIGMAVLLQIMMGIWGYGFDVF